MRNQIFKYTSEYKTVVNVLQVMYCCSECRDAAWQRYHKCLCLGGERSNPDHPFNLLLDTWRNMHYPPETASIMLMLKMIAMVKQVCVSTYL